MKKSQVSYLLNKIYNLISLKIFIGFWILPLLLFYGCPESNSPTTGSPGITFLMGYLGGGEFGDNPGIVSVNNKGKISWVSEYYPFYNSTDYVDMKNGRIAMAVNNPPNDMSPIAYMDIDDINNVKFIPLPKSGNEDYYWVVPQMRPQVLSDGRIIIKAVYNTVNPYDDYHDGMLAIYDPAKNNFEFSGSLSPFILAQPEQGADTEGGSMGSSFALSPDETFVCLHAYGGGTDAGAWHEDYKFIVKYDLENKTYSRVLEGQNQIIFISNDNNYVVANLADGKKYKVNVNSGESVLLDSYNDNISVGQAGRKTDLFFKVWRSGGIALFNINSGWLYNPILGDSLKYPYNGLGRGGQFSADESIIYFKASTDFNTNYPSEFIVFATNLSKGATDSNPDSLFILTKEFDSNLFLLLHK